MTTPYIYILACLFFVGGAWLLWRSLVGVPENIKEKHAAAREQWAGRAFLGVFSALSLLIGVAILSVSMRTNLTPVSERAVRLLRYYDLNRNRQIDLPSECSRKMRNGKITPCHAELFQEADADSSQGISLQELEAHLLKRYDLNGDSLIGKEEDLGIVYREGPY